MRAPVSEVLTFLDVSQIVDIFDSANCVDVFHSDLVGDAKCFFLQIRIYNSKI